MFQLKSQSKPIGQRILDAAYRTMMEAIRTNHAPNLWAMHYDPSDWLVRNVLLIPSYAFSRSCIERRKPLQKTAQRADWVGCSILISSIPADARIPVVTEGKVANPSEVRQAYRRLVGLARLDAEARGWTLDVLHAIRELEKEQFSLRMSMRWRNGSLRCIRGTGTSGRRFVSNCNGFAIWAWSSSSVVDATACADRTWKQHHSPHSPSRHSHRSSATLTQTPTQTVRPCAGGVNRDGFAETGTAGIDFPESAPFCRGILSGSKKPRVQNRIEKSHSAEGIE